MVVKNDSGGVGDRYSGSWDVEHDIDVFFFEFAKFISLRSVGNLLASDDRGSSLSSNSSGLFSISSKFGAGLGVTVS